MTIAMISIALGIGLFAGICSGFFGIGGGIIIVPLLSMILLIPTQNAVATSLFALLFPVGLLAVWNYYQAGHLTATEMKTGALIAVGMLVGAFISSKLAVRVAPDMLRISFAFLLIFMAARLLFFTRS